MLMLLLREHLSLAKSIFFILVRASPLAYYTRERGRSHYKCQTEMLSLLRFQLTQHSTFLSCDTL